MGEHPPVQYRAAAAAERRSIRPRDHDALPRRVPRPHPRLTPPAAGLPPPCLPGRPRQPRLAGAGSRVPGAGCRVPGAGCRVPFSGVMGRFEASTGVSS
ncbi:hypothetical protein FLP10_03080 [Agromyces intestinalis]|uniref:Uncharacterized protein n=1 Tax=Agromyces intestinalis TaxID=2592652 RepID=A0A5C1YD12_9MICO|nr:hypothetical protein FLP10_03080 [Agromyces intestinalis]